MLQNGAYFGDTVLGSRRCWVAGNKQNCSWIVQQIRATLQAVWDRLQQIRAMLQVVWWNHTNLFDVSRSECYKCHRLAWPCQSSRREEKVRYLPHSGYPNRPPQTVAFCGSRFLNSCWKSHTASRISCAMVSAPAQVFSSSFVCWTCLHRLCLALPTLRKTSNVPGALS